MNRTKLKMIGICLAIFILGMPYAAHHVEAKSIVLKAVNAIPIESPEAWPMRQLIERIAKQSNGELTIKYIGSYDAIPIYNQAEATRTGAVDLCMTFVGIYSKLCPEVQSLTFSEIEPWEERERGFFDFMVKLHEGLNLRYLGRGIYYDPCFYFLSNKKLSSSKDFKGMKFSTGPVFLPILKELGATGVVMPTPEKYSAMERGVVEGINNPITLSADLSLFEVTKYILDHGLFKVDVAFIMNLDKWKKLPENLKKLFSDIVMKLEQDTAAHFKGIVSNARQKFKDKGVEFISFSPEEAKKFRKMAYDVSWSNLEKRITPENYRKLREMVSK